MVHNPAMTSTTATSPWARRTGCCSRCNSLPSRRARAPEATLLCPIADIPLRTRYPSVAMAAPGREQTFVSWRTFMCTRQIPNRSASKARNASMLPHNSASRLAVAPSRGTAPCNWRDARQVLAPRLYTGNGCHWRDAVVGSCRLRRLRSARGRTAAPLCPTLPTGKMHSDAG